MKNYIKEKGRVHIITWLYQWIVFILGFSNPSRAHKNSHSTEGFECSCSFIYLIFVIPSFIKKWTWEENSVGTVLFNLRIDDMGKKK